MKIPFYKNKKTTELNFELLKKHLLSDNLKTLQKEKENGLNFTITDSYDDRNILEYYIVNHKEFKFNKFELVEFFIESGIDINHRTNKRADKYSALHFAIMKKDLDFVKILLAFKADIEIQDKFGNTPLIRAVMNYRGEVDLKNIIHILLENGASLEKENFYNVSAKTHINNIAGGIDAGYNHSDWDLREIV